MQIRDEGIPIEGLLLDPNNYRFHDDPDFAEAAENRFHEQGVQDRAYRRLRDSGLPQLKNSILRNGFLSVERVVVREYSHASGKYLVVDGNRRVAALRWIREDHEAGIEIPAQVMGAVSAIPCAVLESSAEDPAFAEALMGVRHVSGIKEWGGYQRAKLVAVLRDGRRLESSDIAERLGMTTQEVNRRYRAYKALQQMLEDENYGELAEPSMYPIFHEAVSLPAVKDWLGWDESSAHFSNIDTLEQFYELIVPHETEDGHSSDAKMTTYSQVRDLRDILPNAEARRVLFDGARTFLDALTVAKRDELSRTWKAEVASAIAALQGISVLDVKQLSKEDLEEIEKIREVAGELLENYRKLTA